MAHKCYSPDCEFSLPDNYPLDKCPWHMVPGRGPVKIAAALAVAAAGPAVVLPIKSTRPICTRSSCVRNARNGASALRPLPNRSRKSVLFVTELLQSLRNGHANERQPQRNRSQRRERAASQRANPDPVTARLPWNDSNARELMHHKRLMMRDSRRVLVVDQDETYSAAD